MILAVATLAGLLRTCAPAISADTMRAIVLVESHGYSYAISDNTSRVAYCVPGARVYPCTREQATKIAHTAVQQGHSVDVGIAQVNSGNFRGYRVSAEQMLAPCANLQVASAILSAVYRSSHAKFTEPREALWHAIMAYNSGSLYAGARYVRAVVEVAFSTSPIQTVPSIEILTDPADAPIRTVALHVVARARGGSAQPESSSLAKPESAPLMVGGLNDRSARGDLRATFGPVLSR